MTFSEALEQLKLGKKLKRKNWNGKDQFVFLIKGDDVVRTYLLKLSYEEKNKLEKDPISRMLMHVADIDIADLLAIKTTSNEII